MNEQTRNPAKIAYDYLEKGYAPIPIQSFSKKPMYQHWNIMPINKTNLYNFFSQPDLNIGIRLGSVSNGLVDVDLDDTDAVRFAKYFLPSTNAIFGRKGNLSSHWLYRVPQAYSTKQFRTDASDRVSSINSIRRAGSSTF